MSPAPHLRSAALLLAALLLVPASPGVAAPTPSADGAAVSTAPAPVPASPRLAPGRFGALRAGMTGAEAVRTGMAVWRQGGPPCGRQLELRDRYGTRTYVEHFSRAAGGTDRVLLVISYDRRFATTEGVRVGTRLGTVRARYGAALSRPHRTAYGQYAYDVRSGRRNLTFVTADRSDASTVISINVSRGRPVHTYEGESPC